MKTLASPRALRSVLPRAVLALTLAGCSCDRGEPASAPATDEARSRGDEARAAVAYAVEEPPPAAGSFAPIAGRDAMTALADPQRAGSWAGTRHGGAEHRSAGNFLCRLETLYGRAPVVLPERVAFALRHAESGLVIVAVVDASGPWLGAALPAGDVDEGAETRAAWVVLGLARLIDATAPDDCAYTIRGAEIGVRGGQYF